MYSIDSSKDALNNFNEYLKFYLFKLQSFLDTVNMEIESEGELSKIKEVMTAREMLKHKDTIIRLDKSVITQFKIIEYYLNAGAFEAPQVYDAINAIKKSDILNSASRSQSNNIRKAELETEIKKVKTLIENKDIDFEYFVSLLSKSDLSEEDKISLLALRAFESTKYVKKQTTPSLESIISSVESKGESVDFSDLVTKFEELREKANELKNKFYYLFEGKTTSQLSYHFEAVKAHGKDFINSVKSYSYREGAMIGCLYYIAKSIEDIKTIDTNGDVSDRETYEFYLTDMEKALDAADEVAEYLEKKPDEKDVKPSNILYFTDTHGRLLFNISEFDSADRKSIVKLIGKLENGQYDAMKSDVKSSMVNGTITPICINKAGNIGCTYIRLDDTIVLLLTCDSLKNIYDRTISLEKKNIEYIKRIKEDFKKLSEDEKLEMIREQDELRFNITLGEGEPVL